MLKIANKLARILVLFLSLVFLNAAKAHFVANQKGTLNIARNSAFLVISIPISAFQGVDDDLDGLLSKPELKVHFDAIEQKVKEGILLFASGGAIPLNWVMIDIDHSTSTAADLPASHLIVLGRYESNQIGNDGSEHNSSSLKNLEMHFTLYGRGANEQVEDLTITRQHETQWLRFSSENSRQSLLPSVALIFYSYMKNGAIHVLKEPDHLLFLLVVLSAGGTLLNLIGLLSSFTLGHAATLFASLWGGVSVSDQLIEPGIAATIFCMAAFDGWHHWQQKVSPAYIRLFLVFCCAMVHGLGFSNSLGNLTQWPLGTLPFLSAIVGFNVGIECAQVVVAFIAGLMMLTLKHAGFKVHQTHNSAYVSSVVMVIGFVWFFERVFYAS